MEAGTVYACPICLTLLSEDDQTIEFADFPGPVYHLACVERVGLEQTKAILAEKYNELRAEVEAENAEVDENEDDDETPDDTDTGDATDDA